MKTRTMKGGSDHGHGMRCGMGMCLTISLLLLPGPVMARDTEIAGIKFSQTADIAGRRLMLNGAALRSWVTLRIYAIGLYLTECRASPAEVLALPGAKRVVLAMLRNTTAKELTDALNEGIEDNTSRKELEQLRPRMKRLAQVMSEVGAAPSGSTIYIDYEPGKGTRFSLNGVQKGETIEGEDFYPALLRIWLGERPPETALREALLGRCR